MLAGCRLPSHTISLIQELQRTWQCSWLKRTMLRGNGGQRVAFRNRLLWTGPGSLPTARAQVTCHQFSATICRTLATTSCCNSAQPCTLKSRPCCFACCLQHEPSTQMCLGPFDAGVPASDEAAALDGAQLAANSSAAAAAPTQSANTELLPSFLRRLQMPGEVAAEQQPPNSQSILGACGPASGIGQRRRICLHHASVPACGSLMRKQSTAQESTDLFDTSSVEYTTLRLKPLHTIAIISQSCQRTSY